MPITPAYERAQNGKEIRAEQVKRDIQAIEEAMSNAGDDKGAAFIGSEERQVLPEVRATYEKAGYQFMSNRHGEIYIVWCAELAHELNLQHL